MRNLRLLSAYGLEIQGMSLKFQGLNANKS